jgi:sulfide:quinone oxidoreductase
VNPAAKEMVLVSRQGGSEEKSALPYDIAHLVPPQSAPAWIKAGPPAGPANPGGYVQIDKATMRHTRYGNVFSLGDAGSSPNSKTGVAIRKQAPR